MLRGVMTEDNANIHFLSSRRLRIRIFYPYFNGLLIDLLNIGLECIGVYQMSFSKSKLMVNVVRRRLRGASI